MNRLASWARKWWPGLIPLVLLWIAAVWNGTAPLEADLAARATAALKETVLDKTSIGVSGRDVRLSAEAFSEEGRRSATSQVEAVNGVRLVNDNTSLIPEAKPFVWSIERDVVRVTFSGNAPLPAIRAKLMDAARATLKGTEILDRMTLARGASSKFDNAALLLIPPVAAAHVIGARRR
jgi:OOP family OmpA-OmpF porin